MLILGGFCHFICNCFTVKHLRDLGSHCFTKDTVLIMPVNELFCISVNGKENLSPQDKKGVEASDDPLRASDNPLSLSHPPLFLSPRGQLKLLVPSQGPQELPGLCQFLSQLLAAGAAAGARSYRVAGWQLRGQRSCRHSSCRIPVASSVLSRPGGAEVSWFLVTSPITAGPKSSITHQQTLKCRFPPMHQLWEDPSRTFMPNGTRHRSTKRSPAVGFRSPSHKCGGFPSVPRHRRHRSLKPNLLPVLGGHCRSGRSTAKWG